MRQWLHRSTKDIVKLEPTYIHYSAYVVFKAAVALSINLGIYPSARIVCGRSDLNGVECKWRQMVFDELGLVPLGGTQSRRLVSKRDPFHIVATCYSDRYHWPSIERDVKFIKSLLENNETHQTTD